MSTNIMTIKEVLDYLETSRDKNITVYMFTVLSSDDFPVVVTTAANTWETIYELKNSGFPSDKTIGAFIDEDGDLYLGVGV